MTVGYGAQEADDETAAGIRRTSMKEWTPWLETKGRLRSVYCRLPHEMLGRPEAKGDVLCRCLLDVCDEIVWVFRSHGDAHELVEDAELGQLLARDVMVYCSSCSRVFLRSCLTKND